ncbi:MAG: exodeoxyribonuclease I [Gammaproteobacteria bacterium]|nr:exodeoxyribonuclease I [Gammaproteobacteria bacterium]
MSTPPSFYWHDYETFGISPARDQPAQFAGVRTDLDFNIIDEPHTWYCKPTPDRLPQAEACLLTGITPQMALEKGVAEKRFADHIHGQLNQPGTCALGYNSIRFDDEVTRHLFYRNFIDPYAREWQHGNSRWDLLDMARMCYALRPEGIEWPQHPDGAPSFKLQDLTNANNISHTAAHDALSDVYATIGLARLIKQQQPRLFDYLFRLRQRQEVSKILNPQQAQILLHTSGMIPAQFACTSLFVPLATHAQNRNAVIAYDLRYAPDALLELDIDEIKQCVFTKQNELPENMERIHLKLIHLNKSPALAPLTTWNESSATRIQLTIETAEKHLKSLLTRRDLAQILPLVFENNFSDDEKSDTPDPELMLYRGGFFSNEDRARMQKIRSLAPEKLAGLTPAFEDARLFELFFRYRARNYPDTLNTEEQQRWQQYCAEKLLDKKNGDGLSALEAYQKTLAELQIQYDKDSRAQTILKALQTYPQQLGIKGID